MEHGSKPERVKTVSSDLEERLERLQRSDYVRYLEGLESQVRDKVVIGSRAGTSGFVLQFSEGLWAATYLDDDRLKYQTGQGEIPRDVERLLSSDRYGDASRPLRADLPYAAEPCVIADQVVRAHGLAVVGLAYGERSFNFCFPGDLELDSMLVHDENGRLSLRIFWEQW